MTTRTKPEPEKTDLQHRIDDAGALDREIKRLTEQLKLHKDFLTDIFLGPPRQKLLGGVDFNALARFTDKYEAINPADLFSVLENAGLAPRFFDVVKVDMTALGKLDELPKAEINKLRGDATAIQVSVSFKERA